MRQPWFLQLKERKKSDDASSSSNGHPFLLKEVASSLFLPEPSLKELTLFRTEDEHDFRPSLIRLLERWPDDIGKDFLQDFQYFLGVSDRDFRVYRSMRHQLRLLCSLYLLRKKLLQNLLLSSHEFLLEMRLISTRVEYPFGAKPVVGIAVVVHFASRYECFDDHHVLLAVQKLIPEAKAIKESFLVFHKPQNSIRLFYLEIEKPDRSPFLLSEKMLLKKHLKTELIKSVETLSFSIFGNCHIEEVMRSIVLLGQEIQTLTDIPQVMISFEGSSGKNLIFCVIVVRLIRDDSEPLSASLQALGEPFEYVPERNYVIGFIEETPKEVTVFRLRLSKTSLFLRSDSSLNVYRAREYVYSLLTRALGEIRDYNGGLFSKQLELYSFFKQQFKQEDPELLEDFFHALNPPEMQAILSLSSITAFFELFLKGLRKNLLKEGDYLLDIKEEGMFVYAAVRLHDHAFHERLMQILTEKKLFQKATAWVSLKRYDGLILGYIYRSCLVKRGQLEEVLREAVENWVKEKRSAQVFRFDLQDLPVSLDPRLGGDDMSNILLKLLFEGLMRIGKGGKPVCAIAEQVKISKGERRYTFLLRECFWNNGDPLTAHDFSYAWKKVLSPHFATPFAYLFYIIKNAKQAKEGKMSSEDIGVHVLDERTLVVDLDYPCGYFLELVANPLYSPVNHKVDRLYPNWPLQIGSGYVCNGPFYLDILQPREGYLLKKNPAYWDASAVDLQHIQIIKTNARKALEMFEKGELDWLGRPSRPWQPFFSARLKRPIEKLSATGVCWCSCNVQRFPFQSSKLRLALSYALDRQEIVALFPQDRMPAFTPLPLCHTRSQAPYKEKEREKANLYFEEGLQELGIEREEWPSLTLVYPNNIVRQVTAEAMVRQWEEVLGITVHTKGYAFRDLFFKMRTGDYELGMILWRPLVDDPLYTLNAFKYASEEINFSKWENRKYQQVLDQIVLEGNSNKKEKLLRQAETILEREMPVIPISYEAEFFSRAEHVEGVVLSKIGNIDFKSLHIRRS